MQNVRAGVPTRSMGTRLNSGDLLFLLVMLDQRPVLAEVELGAIVEVVARRALLFLRLLLGDADGFAVLLLQLLIATQFGGAVFLAGPVAIFAADVFQARGLLRTPQIRLHKGRTSSDASRRRGN